MASALPLASYQVPLDQEKAAGAAQARVGLGVASVAVAAHARSARAIPFDLRFINFIPQLYQTLVDLSTIWIT